VALALDARVPKAIAPAMNPQMWNAPAVKENVAKVKAYGYDVLEPGSGWTDRICGLRANASRLSHAELDEAEELDEGDPEELANEYVALRERLPRLTVLGGCCGTDHRHVDAMSKAWQ